MRVFTKGTSCQMMPCDHEEADTRLLVHVIDSLNDGCSTCLVRTVYTDVVIILVGKFNHLLTLNLSAKIWAAFGTGKNFAYCRTQNVSGHFNLANYSESFLSLTFSNANNRV